MIHDERFRASIVIRKTLSSTRVVSYRLPQGRAWTSGESTSRNAQRSRTVRMAGGIDRVRGRMEREDAGWSSRIQALGNLERQGNERLHRDDSNHSRSLGFAPFALTGHVTSQHGEIRCDHRRHHAPHDNDVSGSNGWCDAKCSRTRTLLKATHVCNR